MSLRPPSEVHRRSRTKSVVSRRAVSSRSSSGRLKSKSTTDDEDELTDLDQGFENDEILSCFLDEPDEIGFQVNNAPPETERGRLDSRQPNEEVSLSQTGPPEQPVFYYYSDSDTSELVQLRSKPKQSRASESSQDHFKSHGYQTGDASSGDIEPVVLKNKIHQLETKLEKRKDFTDMALARNGGDKPDIGLARAELVIFRRERPDADVQIQHTESPRSKKFEPNVKFGWFDMVIGIIAITVFFVDIGTDIEIAAHYYRKGMYMFGGVTTGLIVWPSLVTTTLGLHWYIIDYKKEKDVVKRIHKAQKKAYITPGYVWFLRFFFTLLQMGPALRIMAYMYYGSKSMNKNLDEKKRKRYYHFMLYEDVDSGLLRLFESFLEAAPQLCWQLYIAMVLKESDDVVGTSFRAITLLSSWASLAISLVSHQRSLRNSNTDKAKMKWLSVPFYFVWRASEIGGRVICIATFASTFQLWVFGPLVFHWFFMSVWLMAQKTSFYNNTCQEKVFNVICGYVMIFCFLNLREGVTRYRYLLFYVILYVENFFMLGFWFRFTRDLDQWYHLGGFITILVLFVLHLTFQLLYYGFFHPSENIQFCLSCSAETVYESLCYDLESTVEDPEPQHTETLIRNVPSDSIGNHTHDRNNHIEHRVTTV